MLIEFYLKNGQFLNSFKCVISENLLTLQGVSRTIFHCGGILCKIQELVSFMFQ